MHPTGDMRALLFVLCLGTVALSSPNEAAAHCDTHEGPVVKAGQKALQTGDLDLARIWVKADAEVELKRAFEQALAVRKLNGEARELADRYFLETLVRLHRAGEGEPYTGIRPKGTDIGPVIPAADAAIVSNSSRAVAKLIVDATQAGLQHRLERVVAHKTFPSRDIRKGRAYVEAYVAFTHYVEALYATATAGATSHAQHEKHATPAAPHGHGKKDSKYAD